MSIHRVVMRQAIPSIGMTFENAVHFDNVDGALTNAQIATDIVTYFMPRIQNFQTWFLGWQYLYIYRVGHPEIPVYIHDCANSPGLANVGYLYPTTGYKLKWQTTAGGRHGRGRFFIAGSRSDWATAGGITASAVTNGGIHLAAIVSRYGPTGTAPLRLGLIHKGGGESTYSGLVSAQFWVYLGQQRRRQYGVGI